MEILWFTSADALSSPLMVSQSWALFSRSPGQSPMGAGMEHWKVRKVNPAPGHEPFSEKSMVVVQNEILGKNPKICSEPLKNTGAKAKRRWNMRLWSMCRNGARLTDAGNGDADIVSVDDPYVPEMLGSWGGLKSLSAQLSVSAAAMFCQKVSPGMPALAAAN